MNLSMQKVNRSYNKNGTIRRHPRQSYIVVVHHKGERPGIYYQKKIGRTYASLDTAKRRLKSEHVDGYILKAGYNTPIITCLKGEFYTRENNFGK